MGDIIDTFKLKYNIGLDVGNNITNILFTRGDILPCVKKISFIIPEIDEDYNISLVIGNNILASDNILLQNIIIKLSNIKVIYLHIIINLSHIIINVNSKSNHINIFVCSLININIPILIKDIDIDKYILQFDLRQMISIINKKINSKILAFDIDDENILKNKLKNLELNIHTLTNQKILEIKNTLATKFHIN